MNTVEIKDLRKSYGEIKAVDGLSLQIPEGKIFGLLGPNGAGKTTALEIIEGIRTPDSGDVLVMGHHTRKEREQVKSLIGIQLQSSSIDPLMTPQEAVQLYAFFYGLKKFDVDNHLRKFGLEEKKKVRVKTLSGGQSQRLMLALATIHDPDLLILDEPTAALDPQSRQYIWQLLRDLREKGKTTIISTHFVLEAEELCDQVAIIDFGKLIQLGTPSELIAKADLTKSIMFESQNNIDVENMGEIIKAEVITMNKEGQYQAQTDDVTSTMNLLMQYFAEHDLKVAHLRVHEPSLEDVFIFFTGRSLRA